MIFGIVIGIVLLIFCGLIFYFFNVAFVKQNLGDLEDVNSPANKPLENFKEAIREGIEYVYNTPHKWVYTVSLDGLKLAARYYNAKSDTTIILFHGYRSSAARDFSCAIKMYLNMGYNILLVDQRSHGRSEGRLITFGVKERYDVLVWAEYAIQKYGAKRIILDGMSMGATTVLLACGLELPPEVSCVIADCGYTSPIEIIKKVSKQYLKINATFILPFLNLLCLIFGRFSLYGVNTVDVVKNTDLPILFVHGKADNFVPCEMSETAFKNANKKSRLVTVEGAAHGVSYLVDTRLVDEAVKDFLKNI